MLADGKTVLLLSLGTVGQSLVSHLTKTPWVLPENWESIP